MSQRPRLLILDVLRGVAIVLVLGRHMAPPPAGASMPLASLAGWWIQVGWVGVDLFFVLSGFLVSGLLFTEYQRHGSVDVLRFLVRRGFKIYPGFYFMIAVTIAAAIAADTFDTSMVMALGAEVLYVQNYFPAVWNHTWSLAVEEHFYVLLALCVYALMRGHASTPPPDPFRRAVRLAIFIVVAITVGRVLAPYGAFLSGQYLDPTQLRYTTHTRIDTLLVGVILSYVYHFHRVRFIATVERHRLLITVVSTVLLTPPFFWRLGESPWLPSIGVFSLALGFGGVLALSLAAIRAAPGPARAAGRVTTAFGFVGLHSYSVYLWHMPVVTLVMPYIRRTLVPQMVVGEMTFLIETAAYVVVAIVAGVVIGTVVEQPALSLRDRLFPTRSGGMSVSMRHRGSGDTPLSSFLTPSGGRGSGAEDSDVGTAPGVPHRL